MSDILSLQGCPGWQSMQGGIAAASGTERGVSTEQK